MGSPSLTRKILYLSECVSLHPVAMRRGGAEDAIANTSKYMKCSSAKACRIIITPMWCQIGTRYPILWIYVNAVYLACQALWAKGKAKRQPMALSSLKPLSLE